MSDNNGHKKISVQIENARKELQRLSSILLTQADKGLVEAQVKDFVPGETVVVLTRRRLLFDTHETREIRYTVMDLQGRHNCAGERMVGLREEDSPNRKTYNHMMSTSEHFWVEKKTAS